MTATQIRWFGTRSIVNPDNEEHAAMGWVSFGPCATFEQVRVRMINHLILDGLSRYSTDETRTRCLELARQLTELDEPLEAGDLVRVEAGGLRYAIRSQG